MVSAPIPPNASRRATTSSGVPAAPLARSSSGLRPIAAARRPISGGATLDLLLVASAADDLGGGEVERLRIAAAVGTGGVHAGELRLGVGQGGEGQVELVGVGRGEPGRALGAASAHNEGRVRVLGRLGQTGTVLEVEVTPVEAEFLVRWRAPEPG